MVGIILCNHSSYVIIQYPGIKKPGLFRTEGARQGRAGQGRAGKGGGMEAAFSSMLDDLISYHVMARQHSKGVRQACC